MNGPSPAELAAITQAQRVTDSRPPAEVREAMDPEEPVISGIRLLPLSMGHMETLEAIGSPLLFGGSAATTRDINAALFVLSHPSLESYRLRKCGKLDEAIAEFSDALPMASAKDLVDALSEHIDRAFANALPMKSRGVPAEKKMMDSAGN
jgi:hypothetical protein